MADKIPTAVVAVTTFPRVYLTQSMAEDIQKTISACIFNRMSLHNLALPKFTSNPYLDNGVLKIECGDNALQNLSRYFNISNESSFNRIQHPDLLELRIKFIANYKTPNLIECSITVPRSFEQISVVHAKLSAQNKEYDIDNWYYIRCVICEKLSTCILKYYVPKEILNKMEKDNYRLSFGFGCVSLIMDTDH